MCVHVWLELSVNFKKIFFVINKIQNSCVLFLYQIIKIQNIILISHAFFIPLSGFPSHPAVNTSYTVERACSAYRIIWSNVKDVWSKNLYDFGKNHWRFSIIALHYDILESNFLFYHLWFNFHHDRKLGYLT